ncbi:type II secretion system F family protein [Enterovibrio coralii]|uniref:type II secretion system F family protein n=1 Tax=Enterovibrio coralii TaxID=294935 RepID=UPI0022B657BA|nr:type II secretion system F family protein [Enterovibrio coralii]
MKNLFFQYLSRKGRLELYKLLADLIDDGVPLYNALQMLKNKEGEKVYGKTFIKKMDIIIGNMKKSSSVTDALVGLVPPQDLMVINSAEESAQLSSGLRTLVEMIEKNDEISSALKKSLMAPIILFSVVLFVIMGYSLQVFPTFLGVLPFEQWPGVTKSLYSFGEYLANGGMVVIFGVAIGISIIVYSSMPILKGRFRNEVLDKIPPYNYYRVIQLGLFF